MHLVLPDSIVHDAGTNFMGAAFQANTDMLHIQKDGPRRFPNSMIFVERCHASIRRTININCKEAPDIGQDEALQLAVEAINDFVGPDGLVLTLLVFGALPRLGLPTDRPTPSTFERAAALRKAISAMSKDFAKRQARVALNTRNGSEVSDIHKAPIGFPVLVYRRD